MASPPIITKELQLSLSRAFKAAGKHRHEYVTLEHLLLAMLEDPQAGKAVKACGGNQKDLQKELSSFLKNSLPLLPEGIETEPQQTMAVERVLHRAAIHAISAEMKFINSITVLIQMFREKESHAVYLLQSQGINSFNLKQYVSHSMHEDGLPERDGTPMEGPPEESEQPQKDPLESYTRNLIQEAKEGRIDPVIGRESQIERAIQVLCRRKKNTPVFIGEPGVGKTAIVEGLALKISKNEVPEALADAQIFALDMGSLLAGTKFRGQFEERLKGVVERLKEIDNGVLFIDEIHTIVGAGATSGGSLDASNLLKPALAAGTLKCMGATTHSDYKYLEKDRALARRFQPIDVPEPSVDETIEILKGLKRGYENHHKVKYDTHALEAAAQLSAKHITERFLPDKAIDVIDEAGAADRMKPEGKRRHKVTAHDIEAIISKIAKVPLETVSAKERTQIKNLAPRLQEVIFGQDEAIASVTSAVTVGRAGLRDPNKPLGSFLFAGPTGVGKTELAKQLAETMGVHFMRFDMSEYAEKHSVSRLIGAPPGYVGFDQGGLLTDEVRKHPHSVIILDEIEKAHPEIFNILLQVMDHAKLTDNNGRQADFRHAILIMTTNAGAFEASEKVVGFGTSENSKDNNSKERTFSNSRSKAALERMFTPEFRNRLDATVQFNTLSTKMVHKIVDKEITALQNLLHEKEILISLTPKAKNWLAEHGYDPNFGARPMARLIEQELKKPISIAIVANEVTKGQKIKVTTVKDKLQLKFNA